MIITKLIGGLGNQMFQYAVGRRAAIANKTALKLDITGYEHQMGITKRRYMLYIFHIEEQFAMEKEIAVFKKPKSFLQRIFSGRTTTYVKEKHFHFDPQVLSVSDNTYLEGYWASEKYFEDISDVIRKEFTLKTRPDGKNRNLLKRIDACNSVSIHVRRNDYVHDRKTNKYHGVCGLDYYHKAVSIISRKVKNPHFFIFSDDPQWCQQNFRLEFPATIVTHNYKKQDYEDMRLMGACKHNIIANSSFSWWGAWLNINEDKIVIAPSKWFANTSINTDGLIPKQWVRI